VPTIIFNDLGVSCRVGEKVISTSRPLNPSS